MCILKNLFVIKTQSDGENNSKIKTNSKNQRVLKPLFHLMKVMYQKLCCVVRVCHAEICFYGPHITHSTCLLERKGHANALLCENNLVKEK
jgi:hypothetical protein